MPTPYGSRGGMAFGVSELRVLRRALALALHPDPASAEEVQDCVRLAESLDEAMREGARLRAFLVADLVRYRAALPGTAAGYFTLLEEALGAGYRPDPDDLAALRALRGNPVAALLLDRCRILAEQDVRARLAGGQRRPADAPGAAGAVAPAVPASRARLLALPGGREPLAAGGPKPGERPERVPGKAPGATPARTARPTPGQAPGRMPMAAPEAAPGPLPGRPPEQSPEPVPGHSPGRTPERKPGPTPGRAPGNTPPEKPAEKPAERPSRPAPAPAPQPSRPVPTPGEVFPRRKPVPPSRGEHRQLAVG